MSCFISNPSRAGSSGSMVASTTVTVKPKCRLSGESKIAARTQVTFSLSSILAAASDCKIKSKLSNGASARNIGVGSISARLKSKSSARANAVGKSSLISKYVDKFNSSTTFNNIPKFLSTQKLYPISDIVISLNNSTFIDKNLNTSNLYSSIDDGVFTGDYLGSHSSLISDEKSSYIQPSSVLTSGTFRYKCGVTAPSLIAKNSLLYIRASAPLSNYDADIPPEYKLSNIKLEDPSGNLIIKYKDITLRGDADYNSDYVNFATYITEPEINNLLLNTWENDYPLMGLASGYSLNIDFNVICLDDPFNSNFDVGYEDTCDTNIPNNIILVPTNSLRISAIEICNSGTEHILREQYLNFYAEVPPIGNRITRYIAPDQVLSYNFDSTIFPSITSVWKSSPDIDNNVYYNTSINGSKVIVSKIQNPEINDYITLDYINPSIDSGKLNLQFSHKAPESVTSLTGGAFEFGNINLDQFNKAKLIRFPETDNFFTIDSVELKVVAKKAIGTRDYVLDVVGYSDDKILNVTSKVGGFLQNLETTGNIPTVSGFAHVDDFGFSSESISSKDQYYEKDLTNIGDHYVLSTSPIISGTTFAEYTIPLKIYEDQVLLGKSKDYSMSSSFEKLYLDIYPIPSGASIASIQLLVSYKPSNGLMLHSVGQANEEVFTRSVTLLPSTRQSLDDIINTGPDYSPTSLIAGIPQGYKTVDTLKTNYSRRWRGVYGTITNGPYTTKEFGLSFYNPQSNTPFLNGIFTFNYDSGNSIISDPIKNISTISGTYIGSYNKTKNLGLRFNNNSLFSSPTTYKTIDWTSISGYSNHELYGQIADAYDNIIRVSGSAGYIDFGNIDTASGFSIYVRFSPDINMSGVGYNLWNSGIIFAKYDNGKNLEFALGYNNEKLIGYARASNGTIKTVEDSKHYYEYQYPLAVVLTYNDALSNKLKLYVDNELSEPHTIQTLRDQSSQFTFASGNSSLTFGYSKGHGIGVNAFISEIGISTYNAHGTNLIDSENHVDISYNNITVDNFFDGLRHKFWQDGESYDKDRFSLWKFIDDNTSDWHLGDFNVCAFSPDYSALTERIGIDYIIHHLKHDGSSYSQITNLSLPSSVLASGLAYHSQIENDFLRFNLEDLPNNSENFYSINPRITKTMPRGYQFLDRAIVVDSIIEHDTCNDIVWSDGKVGPKLIVSLYTKNQESVNHPSKSNWGLVNRHIHYLKPSGCYQKISSTFDFENLIDESEPWANFDLEHNTLELDHKYYSKDINDMFLQYDLAYPSGSPFDSTIKIHSANVRLEESLLKEYNTNTNINLVASGEQKALNSINLYNFGFGTSVDYCNLFSSGAYAPVSSSVMNLFSSGAYYINDRMPLYLLNIGTLDIFGNNFGSIEEQVFGSNNFGFPLYIDGRYEKFDEQVLPFVTQNLIVDQSSDTNLSLFTEQRINTGILDDYLDISIKGIARPYSRYNVAAMSLIVSVPDLLDQANNNFDLFVMGEDYTITPLNNSVGLFAVNYSPFGQNLNGTFIETIEWDNNNVGSNITVNDNRYASLNANDEIRGVELICYGTCNSVEPCKDDGLIIHGDYWNPIPCVDGGIFRALRTYTNLETSGFNSPVGYSGHFYGIRKFTGLIPNAPYRISVDGDVGSDTAIHVPKQIDELEYGINSYVAYSGTKLVANNPYYPSGRQANSLYGKSVSAKNDLIAIGAPHYSFYDPSGYLLQDAGTVFLYRRNNQPNGSTWPSGSDKAAWSLETRLTLPSGYVRDYYIQSSRSIMGDLPDVIERNWIVGQEGRQFGHSVALAINSGIKSINEESREVIVVGGPSANWTRTFPSSTASGVQIGLMIFTDEFTPIIDRGPNLDPYSYKTVLDSIAGKDVVFRYFASPAIYFDVKLIILQPTIDSDIVSPEFPEPKPTFITKRQIYRRQGSDLQTEKILSGIKEAFHEAFPYDTSKINNNIPPLVGFYIDNSRSLGKSALNGNGGGAIDQFIDYYKQYSFASGLTDFYGNKASGVITEFVPQIGAAENWVVMSMSVLNHTLDTGRLAQNDEIKYLTSGIGASFFDPNIGEFNHNPVSGGKVYVFEKENGEWSLIQQIDSPTNSYDIPDRFGHAVAISDDTEVIAIGSPYINEACQIYEYRPEEKIRLYNNLETWLAQSSSANLGLGRYANLYNEYLDIRSLSGNLIASKNAYSQLNTTERFDIRRLYNINEYEKIYTYSYEDIPIIGTWGFITEAFLPTSRLGYSVATNEDGSIVAFGAPTDSLNQFDDRNVYYKNGGYYEPLNVDNINGPITSSWKSNTNAGAIRVFESRKYYPHTSVVEFTKFGNLQQSNSDPEDALQYNYLSGIFNDKNFRKTDFTDVNIPEDAGLAFIITPEIDAVSDEIIDNIIKWLSLGDRNLVLVGNDPIWEDNGIYLKSNEIINKILNRLNSRMRLHPARNIYEALASGCPFGNNVIPSFIPNNGIDTYINPQQLKGYGVADIRMHFPNYLETSPCQKYGQNGGLLNTKCELPLKHNGDLRAHWKAECSPCAGDLPTIYEVNWPLVFQTFKPNCCDLTELAVTTYDLVNQEPKPLLAAAEYSKETTITYPAIPPASSLVPIYKNVFYPTTSYEFDESALGENVEFIWSPTSGNYISLNTNLNKTLSNGRFYTPQPFGDSRALLQSVATSVEETYDESYTLETYGNYCVSTNYSNTTSQIILIAGTDTESQAMLYSGQGDRNINFYANIVSKNTNGEANIAQLGAWTGRTHFNDGIDSILQDVFSNIGNNVTVDAQKLYSSYDVCWIADTLNLPSEEQLNELKNWLNIGNKKLVITYGNSKTKARLISQLCDMLGISIKPLYFPGYDDYASLSVNSILSFNPNSSISQGFDINSSIGSFILSNQISYIPIKTANGTRICYDINPLTDIKKSIRGYWNMKSGVAKVTFPVVAGSGYKLYINMVRETELETQPLNFIISDVTFSPTALPQKPASQTMILDINNDTNSYVDVEKAYISNAFKISSLEVSSISNVHTRELNIQAPIGVSSFSIYINANSLKLDESLNKNNPPKSIRLVSISGVAMPIKTINGGEYRRELDRYEYQQTDEGTPEITVVIPSRLIEISTDNSKYCIGDNCIVNEMNNQLIADGPVVAAQEVETVSSFSVGVARSRITVLSDSSFVQGPCLVEDNGVIPDSTYAFIRSLYPNTVFPLDTAGRHFNTITKLMSPERGSPQKYYAINNNSGINQLFRLSNSQGLLSSFSDIESYYDPKYVVRPKDPWGNTESDSEIKAIKQQKIGEFLNLQAAVGSTTKFSGIIEGKLYADIDYRGGMPNIMKDTGYDYLDFDRFPSGYPGDLFGFALDIEDNKIIVSSPFAGFSNEKINRWSYYVNGGSSSGVQLGDRGGAGAVYIFEKTYNGSGIRGQKTPWEMTNKIRPQNISTGDEFGYSLSINKDVLAIGAPKHKYTKYIVDGSGSFIKKCFNLEFNIRPHDVYDLGYSGNRLIYGSGEVINNNGAILVFENQVVDWNNRIQDWVLVEKALPLQTSGTINNNYFGKSTSITKSNRTDADYILIGGSPNHKYDISGQLPLNNAGSVYNYDIMLRDQAPSNPNPNTFIQAKVFGETISGIPSVSLSIKNNQNNNELLSSTGIVYSNSEGEIFLEASGQDLAPRGFSIHRPYIKSVYGQYFYGTENSGNMPLFANGRIDVSGQMNLINNAANSAFVYNTMGLYESAIINFASGEPSGLSLYLDCPPPVITANSGLSFHISGVGINSNNLNMRIRGK